MTDREVTTTALADEVVIERAAAFLSAFANTPGHPFSAQMIREVEEQLLALKAKLPQEGRVVVELPYERLDDDALCKGIRLKEGERVLVLQPFGWHIDGSHIPNAAEHFERDYICDLHHWQVVHEFGPYIAIVRSVEVKS